MNYVHILILSYTLVQSAQYVRSTIYQSTNVAATSLKALVANEHMLRQLRLAVGDEHMLLLRQLKYWYVVVMNKMVLYPVQNNYLKVDG
jgi:hypothetical protein